MTTKRTNGLARRVLVLGAALLLTAAAAAGPPAEVRLKDGTRWRGAIDDHVAVAFFQQGIEVTLEGYLTSVADQFIVVEGVERKTIFRGDIVSIRTIVAGEVRRTGADARADLVLRDPARHAIKRGAPGVIVLPLEGSVGCTFLSEDLERVGEIADGYGPGQIIVFIIGSGGGVVTEMEQIQLTLRELKKRHRLVAWIREALAAACAAAILCDEIYFMTPGTAGSMTVHNTATGESWKGEQLERWLAEASRWMVEGGRDPRIARAMIHNQFELSYDRDPLTGEVRFHDDLSGAHVLSKKGQNLTFNASNAVHCGFADGIADTEVELARLLDLPKWHEITDEGRRLHESRMAIFERAEREIPLLVQQLEYKGSGGGRISMLGSQLSIVKRLLAWWRRCPPCCRSLGLTSREELERLKGDLQRALARERG